MKTEMCCLRAQSLLTFPVCVLEVSCAWCHSQQSRDSLCFLKDFWIADNFPLDHSYFCWDAQPTSLHLKGSSWPSGGLFSYDFIREDSLDLYPELNLSHPVLCLQINSSIYIYKQNSLTFLTTSTLLIVLRSTIFLKISNLSMTYYFCRYFLFCFYMEVLYYI